MPQLGGMDGGNLAIAIVPARSLRPETAFARTARAIQGQAETARTGFKAMNRICLNDRFVFRGCLPPQVSPDRVCFVRAVENEGCFRFDSPGARICFRTDARNVTARLTYNAFHTIRDAATGRRVWMMDG